MGSHDLYAPRSGLQMVSTCPSSWKESFIIFQCESQADGIPVFDEFGYNYRNIFCAICHYRELNMIHPWKEIPSDSRDCFRSSLSIGGTFLRISDNDAVVGNRIRWCYADPCTTLSNSSLVNSCRSYLLLRCICVLYVGFKDCRIFKNHHCSRCVVDDLLELEFEDRPMDYIKEKCYFPMGISPNSWKFRSYSAVTTTPAPDTPCLLGEFRDPTTQLCRKVSCRPGFSVSYFGQCVLNNDTNLPTTNNWNCINQKMMIFFKSQSLNYISTCVKDKLANLDIGKQIMLDYAHMEFEDIGIKWTVLTFSNTYSFELLQKIEEEMQPEFIKQERYFCGVTEVQAYISCDKRPANATHACRDSWYSGTPFEFWDISTKQRHNVLYHVTKDIYIVSKSIIYYESFGLETRDLFQPNKMMLVCGKEVRNFLECVFITLEKHEYIVDINKTVLVYRKQDIRKGDFLQLPDGKAQVCIDSIPDEVKKKTPYSLFLKPLDIVNLVTTCFSLCGSLGTLVTYMRFKQLRNNMFGYGIISLVVALFKAQVFTVFSKTVPLSDTHCVIFGAITHYYWLATFTWTTILGAILLHKFALNYTDTSDVGLTSRLLQQLLGWGLPLLIVALSVILHFCECLPPSLAVQVYDNTTCWLRVGNVNLLAFGIPVCLCLVTNIIMVTFTLIQLRKARQRSNVMQQKSKNENEWREFVLFGKVRSNLKT
ncbi:uncharacterized protein [Amphiura filiformis]|uniref:uncharacterized protein n=1 Tax=Amphiura filiformis TaxID=82378 RepID=UPI003B21220A